MAVDGTRGRAGHAAHSPGATVHAAAHVRQRGPMFRELPSAYLFARPLSHLPGRLCTRECAGGDGQGDHLLSGRERRVHAAHRRHGGCRQGHLQSPGCGGVVV